MERRFHSPYAHWISGFAYEAALFAGFIGVLVAVSLLAMWIGR